MREIKFRGKHKNPYGDKWVYGYYALEDGEHVIIMPHSTSYEKALKENRPIPSISVNHTIDINTLGQYTGLKDKNGKEIYEGDILRFSEVDTAVVEWNEQYAYFMAKPIQEYYFDSDVLGHAKEYNNVEIIGNIYDNPNLLEKGKEDE